MKKQRLAIGDSLGVSGVSLDGLVMKGLCEVVTFNLGWDGGREGGREGLAKSLLDSTLVEGPTSAKSLWKGKSLACSKL